MEVLPIGAGAELASLMETAKTQAPSGASGLSEAFSMFLKGAEMQQAKADNSLEQMVAGETDNIHDVVLHMAKADLSFQLVMEIRNQLIEAYQEVMRMQV